MAAEKNLKQLIRPEMDQLYVLYEMFNNATDNNSLDACADGVAVILDRIYMGISNAIEDCEEVQHGRNN